LKRKNKDNHYLTKMLKIGCRIPDHAHLNKYLKNFNFPITSTSANYSGQKSLKRFRDCCRIFSNKSCIILKNKIGSYKKPSRIIDFDSKKIIRN